MFHYFVKNILPQTFKINILLMWESILFPVSLWLLENKIFYKRNVVLDTSNYT